MKKIIDSLKRFAGGLSANNINAHAAASAFYMFLSLVPFVALISAVIPYTGLRQEALLSAVSSYIPDALNSLIHGIVNDIYKHLPQSAFVAVNRAHKLRFVV